MLQWWCILHIIKCVATKRVSRVLVGVAKLVFGYGPNKFFSDIGCTWCLFISLQAWVIWKHMIDISKLGVYKL